MSAAAPAGATLLPFLPRLQLLFESSASLVAMDADEHPVTLEWGLPHRPMARTAHDASTELTVFSMSGLTLDLWRIGRVCDSLDSCDTARPSPGLDAP
ncbi:hypothetical protein ACFWMG_11760 [Streptomyces sp. NPDC127074]|uniref:hypothetical protein n=1 Tax=Streptomyces sp. NPDC127074 TaxID=3347130 RepID=UPI00365B46F1